MRRRLGRRVGEERRDHGVGPIVGRALAGDPARDTGDVRGGLGHQQRLDRRLAQRLLEATIRVIAAELGLRDGCRGKALVTAVLTRPCQQHPSATVGLRAGRNPRRQTGTEHLGLRDRATRFDPVTSGGPRGHRDHCWARLAVIAAAEPPPSAPSPWAVFSTAPRVRTLPLSMPPQHGAIYSNPGTWDRARRRGRRARR